MISYLKRLFRRQERMHKRPFVTAVTVFVVFLLAASMLFVSLGILGMESDYPQVTTTMDKSGLTSSGLGVNLSYIPSTNLVWDPSFESSFVENVFSVAEASGNAIYLHSSSRTDENTVDSYYHNGNLRVMTYDEEGNLSQTIQASILDYQTNQLGIWKPIENDFMASGNITSICSDRTMTMGLLEDGNLVLDLLSTSPYVLETKDKDDPFVAASVLSSRYYAVTASGHFYVSGNGKNWSEAIPSEDMAIKALTSIGRLGIACGEQGQVLVCDSSRVYVPALSATCDFYTAVSNGTDALLAGSDGRVYTTSNGSIFRVLTKDEIPTDTSDTIVLSSYANGEFVLITSSGRVFIGEKNEEKGTFSFQALDTTLAGVLPVQLALFDGGDIWVLGENGFIYAFSRKDGLWQQVFAEQDSYIRAMGVGSGTDLVVSRGGYLYSTSMYTKVTIDQDIGDAEIQNGDMCYLSVSVPSISDPKYCAWETMGENTQMQCVADAPKTLGSQSLILFSTDVADDQAHFVSQVISRDEVAPMQEKAFYHIRVWLKQTHLEKAQVMAWISGLSEPIGTTFTDVSGNWREYTFTFAWPASASKSEEEIRLNIGFYGSGEVYMDGVRLEREAFSETQIEPKLQDALEKASPEFIRLDNLGLGSVKVSLGANLGLLGNEHMVQSEDGTPTNGGVVSLESSLRLVKQVNSNPWFTIDSAFSESELNVFLSYLCGGITDAYGKLRIDNGTAVPWQRQFERIVIELNDSSMLFETDLQKSAYVDYMISLFTQSAYYADIKDKVLFIDGMSYESGTMTSSADYHTSSLTITNDSEYTSEIAEMEMSTLITSAYQDFTEMTIPRIPSSVQDTGGEWISSLRISMVSKSVSKNEIITSETPLNASSIIQFLLEDLGRHTAFVAIDLPVSRMDGDADASILFSDDHASLENRKINTQNAETLLSAIGVLHDVTKGQRIETAWVAPLSKQKDKDYSIDLISYAYYSNGNIYLIIINPTEKQQQFLIETDTPIRDISVSRYSASCKKIALASTGSLLRLNERRYTLQAGQICVAVIPAPEK